MEFDAEDMIALYLLEHPEDEAGITTVNLDGVEEQFISREVLVRFVRWGATSGYFDPLKVQEFIPWVEQLKMEEA